MHQWFDDAITNGHHDTREFHAGNVSGPTWRSRIEACALHEVRGVNTGRVHLDDHVVGPGLGRRTLFDFQ
jgi:hypothetical protein